MPQAGMLLQVDGSRHQWFGPDGPWLTLIGAIDDATGDVPYALFRQQEDAQGYLLLLREVVRRHGVPLALYSDRHKIFQSGVKEPATLEEQLAGKLFFQRRRFLHPGLEDLVTVAVEGEGDSVPAHHLPQEHE